ncbi:hypothetical protein D9V84_02520 [Bacteroidetes/Chlorobi group bacterium Naka2016]|jgi:hypothetical protein|nr:MAG: hypothetical protein D9V84_02520 [Bacteroidetes/Chlorobi group bacterium Naka2016]
MVVEILREWEMARRWESDWIPFVVEENISSVNQRLEATCIEFTWRQVAGILSGKIKFIVSNNQRTSKLLKEIEIASVNNEQDSYFLNIYYPSYLYYKIVYEPNGIASGRLYIGALYR